MADSFRVLVTGASGLIGSGIVALAPSHWDVLATSRSGTDVPAARGRVQSACLDITDAAAVSDAFSSFRPQAIIHLASVGNLDSCEKQTELARRVNVDGVANLLTAAAPLSAAFVFASTIYVLSGIESPLREQDSPLPLSAYARMKLEAESLVLDRGIRPVVLRPTAVFGWHAPTQRQNWVTWLLDRLATGAQVPVVTDDLHNYLWVEDAARAFIAGASIPVSGVFNLGGCEGVSRYRFSQIIAEVFGYPSDLLKPTSGETFSHMARRPSYAVTAIEKMKTELGIDPHMLHYALTRMRDQRLRQTNQ